MKPGDAVPGLFSDVEHYICAATDMVASGEFLRLFELEDKVRALCQAVSGLPVEDGRRFSGKLDDLRRQLDTLQFVMQAQKDKMRDQLAALDKSRKAHQAYAKSDTMGKKEE